MGATVLQIKEHIVDVVKFTSLEGVSERFVEEFVLTCHTSMSWKRSWRQFNSFMTVCIQELFVEEIVDIPVPQIMEEIVDVVKLILQIRTVEQLSTCPRFRFR